MRFLAILACGSLAAGAAITNLRDSSTHGTEDLVRRRLPHHADSFEFTTISSDDASQDGLSNDHFQVTSTDNGKIRVEGNSKSALASG